MRLGIIGDGLRWILESIYHVVPNYGLAVILFTLVIRILLMPLDVKSKRSMARMATFNPQIEAIKKKYANDKEKLNQKTQELYKKEKINPLSGCLPMLLSMPILFSMFAVMREIADEEIVRMVLQIKTNLEAGVLDYYPNYQGFLWIRNVFQADSFMASVFPSVGNALSFGPSGQMTVEMIEEARAFLTSDLYSAWALEQGGGIVYTGQLLMWTIEIPRNFNGLMILPILAGLSQIVATKLNPMAQPGGAPAAGADPKKSTNAMMKYFFPLFSVFICLTSTAGFALYWVAVNIIQVIQQYGIGKWIKYSDARKLASQEVAKP